MADESTRIHGPSSAAPAVTEKVARCEVCGVQWAVRGDPDREGCSFCDAPASAVEVDSEA